MSGYHIAGADGRLGTVLVSTFKARGDVPIPEADLNYLVFAHRNRDDRSLATELAVNLTWPLEFIQKAEFAKHGDCAVVLVGSCDVGLARGNQPLGYSVSKAGLVQAARYLAGQGINGRRIRINCVSPSTFTGKDIDVTKQEVADVIAFLCSPQASGINGQDIQVTPCGFRPWLVADTK